MTIIVLIAISNRHDYIVIQYFNFVLQFFHIVLDEKYRYILELRILTDTANLFQAMTLSFLSKFNKYMN